MSHSDRPTLRHETPALIAALSDSALRHASSTAIFQHGKAYASCGAVQVLSEESGNTPAIYAEVTGTDTYAADVWLGTCRRADDAREDRLNVRYRASSRAAGFGHERALLAGSFRVVQPHPATDRDRVPGRGDIRSDTSGRS
jgi:hypothetical protein